MSYLGDIDPGNTLNYKFTTVGSGGAPATLSGSPVVKIYKDNATTTETATGVTLSVDFDGVTGLNNVLIDTSADATFYAAGSNFQIVITTGTVSSISVVGSVLAQFSIQKRSPLRPTTAGQTIIASNLDDTITSRMATYTQPTGFLAAAFPNGTIANTTNITAGVMTTTTNLTNAPTAGDFTATMKTSLNAATPASVVGAVGSVTGDVGGNVVGSVGSVVGLTASNLDATISSRMATYTQPSGFLAATFPNGTIANTTNITAGVMTTTTNLTNAPTAGDFTATMKTSLNAATPASVVGAVGSVAGNVGGNVVGSVGSVVGLTASNLDVAVSSRMATYAQPTGFLASTFPSAVGDATIANQGTINTNVLAIPGAITTDHGSGSYVRNTEPLDAAGTRTAVGLAMANLDSQLAAINAKTTNLPASPAAVGSAMTLTTSERDAIAAAILDLANSIETSLTVRQCLRGVSALLYGQISGAGSGSEVFENFAGDTTRVTVTVDSSGNRTAISLNV